MPDTPVIRARTACLQIEHDREWRREVHEGAREARRRARDVRADAAHQRERVLEQRWTFWAAGWIADPPSYVPSSWDVQPSDPEAVAAGAAAECRRAAGSLLRIFERACHEMSPGAAARTPSVIALCEVAADRLEGHSGEDVEDRYALLGSCARALEGLEVSVTCEGQFEAPVALAVTCRTAAVAIRRALAALLAAA